MDSGLARELTNEERMEQLLTMQVCVATGKRPWQLARWLGE